jgi:hypothetical protein
VDPQLRWRIRKHVLLFAVGIFVGAFLWLPFAPAASWLGISVVKEDQSILKYGGTAMLVNCLVFGTLFYSIGAVFAKRFLPEPGQWSSAVVGGIYSGVAFLAVLFIPMPRGSASGMTFLLWLILFPILAVVASTRLFRRLNPGVQPTSASGRG